MNRYQPHDSLVAPARRSAEPWRLAVGVILIFFGFLLLNIVYLHILQSLPNWQTIRLELSNGSSPRAVWLMLLNFLPLLVVTAVVLQTLHSRNLLSLFGSAQVCIRDFLRVARPLLLLFSLLLFLPAADQFTLARKTEFGTWALLLPVTIPLIFLQISTEELLFRGYLQSQLAARFSSPLVWMLVPSALFGFLHYDPTVFGENAWWIALWSVLFGLAAADLTARSGNLGPALALHLVNNFSALALVSLEGYWDGLALYVLPFGPENSGALMTLMPREALVLLCSWLLARIAIRR